MYSMALRWAIVFRDTEEITSDQPARQLFDTTTRTNDRFREAAEAIRATASGQTRKAAPGCFHSVRFRAEKHRKLTSVGDAACPKKSEVSSQHVP